MGIPPSFPPFSGEEKNRCDARKNGGGGLDRVGNETTGSFFFPFAKFLSLSLSRSRKKLS